MEINDDEEYLSQEEIDRILNTKYVFDYYVYFDKDDDGWYENYDITMIAKLEDGCYVLHIVSYANEYLDIDENNVYVFKTYEDLIDALPLNLYNDFIKSTKKA
jgi:hypothetical protein